MLDKKNKCTLYPQLVGKDRRAEALSTLATLGEKLADRGRESELLAALSDEARLASLLEEFGIG